MQNVFLNTDEFADTVSYTPKGGVAKSIPAIIERQPISPDEEGRGRILGKEAVITIHNDATNGVASVDTNGDAVTFPALPGGSNVDWHVISIEESSDVYWKLRVSQ